MKTQFLYLGLRQLVAESGGTATAKKQAPSYDYEYRETLELVQRVDDACALLQLKGESAFAELRTADSRWRKGENYIFILDIEGNMVVHPDPELEGKNQLTLQDINGKYIVRGLIEAATMIPDKPSGWYHYQWPVPDSLIPRWKSTYVELTETPSGKKYIVGSGTYNDRMERAFVMDTVLHAVAEIEKKGDAAFTLLRDPKGPFIAKDTYIFVTDLDGVELVNPAFPNLEGRNLLDLKDTNGKLLNREMLLLIKTKGAGWADYMWPKPGDSLSTKKSAYVHAAKWGKQTVMVGCGVYLPDAVTEVKRETKISAAELMALVREAATIFTKEGEKAYPLFRQKGSRWFRDEIYFFVFTMDGIRTFHAVEPETENRNDMELRDIHGRPIVKMMTEVAKSPQGEGWIHYMYPEPGEIFPAWKSSYVKKVVFPSGKEYVLGCGIYNMKMDKPFIEDLVNRAAMLIAERGKEAFPIFRDKTGPFFFMDTYVFVQRTDGTELVNPAQPNLEGRNIMGIKDINGREFVKDEIGAAMTEGSSWLDINWYKPGQNIPARKQTFVRKVDYGGQTFIVGSGFYGEEFLGERKSDIQKIAWKSLKEEKLTDLLSRQVLHGEKGSLARMIAKKGAIVARHLHVNEEFLFVLSGSLKYRFDDRETLVNAGETMLVPAGTPHSITVIEDSMFLVFFAPAREDWIRGEDQYLRKIVDIESLPPALTH